MAKEDESTMSQLEKCGKSQRTLGQRIYHQTYPQNPFFDYVVDSKNNLSTNEQMAEASHKACSLAGAAAVVGRTHWVNELKMHCWNFDAERSVITLTAPRQERKPFLPGLKLYAAGAVANAVIDKCFFDDRQADCGTTIVDTFAPLVLLTELNPRLKLAAMILPHILLKAKSPVSPYKAQSW